MAESARYKMVVSYRGTNFHGWQCQTASGTWKLAIPKGGILRTVQGVLNSHIGKVVGHPVKVVGASRTDAGVHAKGQVCHFDTTATHIPTEGLRRAVNAKLPGDVVIREITPVPRAFNAISYAVEKRYQYLVWTHDDRPVFMEDLTFHRWKPLNPYAMKAATEHFVGTHDFASFARPGHRRVTTERTVTSCEVSFRGNLLVIGVSGTGFLWNQVRIMAGTLIEVGLERFSPSDIPRMLAARDRKAAGSTAPASGLYLQWITHRECLETDPVIPDELATPESEDVEEE